MDLADLQKLKVNIQDIIIAAAQYKVICVLLCGLADYPSS